MEQTEINLRRALAAEAAAGSIYRAFAEKAVAEDRPHAARLFRAAAASEEVQVRNRLRTLEIVASTRRNLEAAASGQIPGDGDLYPTFLEEAEQAGHDGASITLRWGLGAEKSRRTLFGELLDALDKGDDLPELWVCRTCGHTHAGERPEFCPVCGAPPQQYDPIS